MRKRPLNRLALPGVGLIALVFIVKISREPLSLTKVVTVEFTDYTTNSSGRIQAVISLQNNSRRTVSPLPIRVQVHDSGRWTPQLSDLKMFNFVIPKPILSGSRTNLMVDVPDHGERWRVPVFFTIVPTWWERFRQGVRNCILRRSLDGFPDYAVMIHTNFSEEFPLPRSSDHSPQ